ncbi:MAG TPA: histidine kinase [Bryobacteraceae bacterium]|jgi:signal transduction histidine kinase|nr:histidine kinase [Bryobacteraceae bacterium]
MEPEETKDAVVFKRSVQPLQWGAQVVLLASFGGMLGLMLFAGIDSLRALRQIQSHNVQIRQTFLVRNRALEEIRSALYQSGTFTRDYLLERDAARAETYRASLQQVRGEMDAALARYARSFDAGEQAPFQALEARIADYWKVLDPIFHWDAAEKLDRSDAFMHEELFPRRATTLEIADRIAAVNEQELNTGDERLKEIFDRFRYRLGWMLALTLGIGVVLAAATMRHILHLARDAELRYREVALTQGKLKELSARLVEAQEEERRAISRELHDEVGQSLSALLMELGNLGAVAPFDAELRSHVESIRKLAESSVSVVRNMALLLRPSMLDDLGLVPALQWQAREISKRTGMVVTVDAETVADDLPEEHKTCVYRVVQEALHNCARHAFARSVRIEVAQDTACIRLHVVDDGHGFDSTHTRGMGLLGMEERVTHLGGTFHLESEPGHGASLDIEIPLAARPVEAIA